MIDSDSVVPNTWANRPEHPIGGAQSTRTFASCPSSTFRDGGSNKLLASTISWTHNPAVVSKPIHTERRASTRINFVAEDLALGIKCCEVALSAGSAATWHRKIENAHKAHDTAQRFVNRFRLPAHQTQRINQRITHLRTLLEELKYSRRSASHWSQFQNCRNQL